jgi:hypothetical protein
MALSGMYRVLLPCTNMPTYRSQEIKKSIMEIKKSLWIFAEIGIDQITKIFNSAL